MGDRLYCNIDSNLESVAPEEDTAVLLRWCQSIGLETVLDVSGMLEHELFVLRPAPVQKKLPPFYRMACRLKRDRLEARKASRLSSLLPENYSYVPTELLHTSHLKGKPNAPGMDSDNAEKEKSLKVARSLPSSR